jgi:hypothetical protein
MALPWNFRQRSQFLLFGRSKFGGFPALCFPSRLLRVIIAGEFPGSTPISSPLAPWADSRQPD